MHFSRKCVCLCKHHNSLSQPAREVIFRICPLYSRPASNFRPNPSVCVCVSVCEHDNSKMQQARGVKWDISNSCTNRKYVCESVCLDVCQHDSFKMKQTRDMKFCI